jgi:hypothetical protein
LKDKYFIPGKASPPRVVLGDWAAGLLIFISAAFPDAYF